VEKYESDDLDDTDADEEEAASRADIGLTQTLEDWGYRTRECEDWPVYFRPVKYDYGDANEMARDVCEAMREL
jgi:hypothetical protein